MHMLKISEYCTVLYCTVLYCKLWTRVLHGSGSGKIPRDYRRIGIKFTENPAVVAVTGVCFAVYPRKRDKVLQRCTGRVHRPVFQ